jgi:hypothetical protein
VRAACRNAATTERKARLGKDSITLPDLSVEEPLVAWQPIRISAKASSVPGWLRVVARVTSSALEGSFDLALAPSLEGPLRGTLDPSWIRPKAKITIKLVAMDKFGDLGDVGQSKALDVPSSEALVSLGEVPDSATVSIDGSKVDIDAKGRVAVSPGEHTVEMELDNGASASTSITVERGGIARVALSPQKGGGRTLAWIATGTSVVLGAVGGVLMINAATRKAEIEELAAKREPGTGLPATEYADLKLKDDDRRTYQTVGTGMLIAGGAVGVAAITLWLIPRGGSKTSKPKEKATLTPLVGIGSVGLRGSF